SPSAGSSCQIRFTSSNRRARRRLGRSLWGDPRKSNSFFLCGALQSGPHAPGARQGCWVGRCSGAVPLAPVYTTISSGYNTRKVQGVIQTGCRPRSGLLEPFRAPDKSVLTRASEVKSPAVVLDIDETSLSNWDNIKADDFGFIAGGTRRRHRQSNLRGIFSTPYGGTKTPSKEPKDRRHGKPQRPSKHCGLLYHRPPREAAPSNFVESRQPGIQRLGGSHYPPQHRPG